MVEMFFNSIFLSIDAIPTKNNESNESWVNNLPDRERQRERERLVKTCKNLLKKHLNHNEYHVLRLSYGLDCDKHSAKQIAEYLSIPGVSAYVRVSELKKKAVEKLIENVDHSQVLDYL